MNENNDVFVSHCQNNLDIKSTDAPFTQADFNSSVVLSWTIPVSNSDRVDIVKKESDFYRNNNGTFHESIRLDSYCKRQKRRFIKDWFFINLADGQQV